MRSFFYFLRADSGFVPPPMVENSVVVIGHPLRPGGTCRAFSASFRQAPVVAKLYVNGEKAAEDARRIGEVRQILTATGAMLPPVAQTPTVVATEAVWLLVTPVGTPFTVNNLRLGHLKRLLQVLKIVHAAGIIHRDVRPANFLLLAGDNDVLLNDWGSAAYVGVSVPVEGSPRYICHPELIDAQEFAPSPKHDLYSLAVSVSGLTVNIRRALFQEAINASEREDYGGVAIAFENAGVRS